MPTPSPDPSGNANTSVIKNVRQLVAEAHRTLVMASSFCHYPGFGDRYHDVGCRVEGAVKALTLALGTTIEQLVQVENELFNERNNNDPN